MNGFRLGVPDYGPTAPRRMVVKRSLKPTRAHPAGIVVEVLECSHVLEIPARRPMRATAGRASR